MTDLTTNFQATVNNVLQESLDIRSKKFNILLWTNPKLPNSFILKDKENKRYIGLPRMDKKGATYWHFKEIAKRIQFRSVMELTKDYEKSNSEPSVNS